MNTKIIIGLGNPGAQYRHTRHNIGKEFVRDWVRRKKVGRPMKEQKLQSYISRVVYSGQPPTAVVIALPHTFMNDSGRAVKKIISFYKVDLNDILVVHDDIDLDLGKVRQVFDSRSGGHNGVESIIQCLGTSKFYRLKIGINPLDNFLQILRRTDAAQFVLGKFGPEEKQALKEIFPQVVGAIVKFFK